MRKPLIDEAVAIEERDSKAVSGNCWEVHYTPKHGSWLNMAEIELGVLRGQCLDRRIPDFTTLTGEVAAWQSDRNAVQVKVNWQCTTADARVKLKRLYPILEPVKNK